MRRRKIGVLTGTVETVQAGVHRGKVTIRCDVEEERIAPMTWRLTQSGQLGVRVLGAPRVRRGDVVRVEVYLTGVRRRLPKPDYTVREIV